MDTGNWITLVAVIVALGIGVSSLIQTQRLQRKERRERLLGEIIEWAIGVMEYRRAGNIKEVLGIETEDLSSEQLDNLRVQAANLHDILEDMLGKTQYASSLASHIKGKKVKDAVEQLSSCIEDHRNLLLKYVEASLDKSISKKVKEINEHAKDLDKAILEVIGLASKEIAD